MKVWIDAQLPFMLAQWLRERFALDAYAIRELGLRDATDEQSFKQLALKMPS